MPHACVHACVRAGHAWAALTLDACAECSVVFAPLAHCYAGEGALVAPLSWHRWRQKRASGREQRHRGGRGAQKEAQRAGGAAKAHAGSAGCSVCPSCRRGRRPTAACRCAGGTPQQRRPGRNSEKSALAEFENKIMHDTDFSEFLPGAASRRTTSRSARRRAGGCRVTSGDSCGGGGSSGGGGGGASEGLRGQGNKDWKDLNN